MKKKYLWTRENYLLNLITMIMCAGSIFFIKLFSNILESDVEYLYNFSDRIGVNEIGNRIANSCFSDYMELANIWYLCMLLGIAVISICLFQDMKAKETQEWMVTLPVTNREVFWHKWLRGMIAYTIPFLVYIAGILTVHQRNIIWIRGRYLLDINWKFLLIQEQPMSYLKVFGMLWLWATACYCIFFFIQVVCKKGILAAMISFGILLTPIYTATVLYRVDVLNSYLGDKGDFIYQIFLFPLNDNTFEEKGWLFYPEAYMQRSYSHITSDLYIVRISDLFIVAIVVIVCLFLSYRYFDRMMQQTQPGIFSICWTRYAILAGFGLCVGMGLFMNLCVYHNVVNRGIFVFGTLIFTVAFTLIVDKLMKRRGY